MAAVTALLSWPTSEPGSLAYHYCGTHAVFWQKNDENQRGRERWSDLAEAATEGRASVKMVKYHVPLCLGKCWNWQTGMT